MCLVGDHCLASAQRWTEIWWVLLFPRHWLLSICSYRRIQICILFLPVFEALDTWFIPAALRRLWAVEEAELMPLNLVIMRAGQGRLNPPGWPAQILRSHQQHWDMHARMTIVLQSLVWGIREDHFILVRQVTLSPHHHHPHHLHQLDTDGLLLHTHAIPTYCHAVPFMGNFSRSRTFGVVFSDLISVWLYVVTINVMCYNVSCTEECSTRGWKK